MESEILQNKRHLQESVSSEEEPIFDKDIDERYLIPDHHSKAIHRDPSKDVGVNFKKT